MDALALRMAEWFAGDPKRSQHLMKVYAYSILIGRQENLPADQLRTLAAAALVHDIGIKPAEEKFGSCDGKLQEQEGPDPARTLLKEVGFDPLTTARVAYLVAHHHTYSDIDDLDLQILIEADFLVNLYEDSASPEAIAKARTKIFKTHTGIRLMDCLFA